MNFAPEGKQWLRVPVLGLEVCVLVLAGNAWLTDARPFHANNILIFVHVLATCALILGSILMCWVDRDLAIIGFLISFLGALASFGLIPILAS
jgi:hypothetical protein